MFFRIEKFPVNKLLYVLILALIMLVPAVAFAQEAIPAISIKKEISIDGGSTWLDAETPPGPYIVVGNYAQFRFVITNSGYIPLDVVEITDDVLDLTTVLPMLPYTLTNQGDFLEFIKQNVVVTPGQHINTATATAVYEVYGSVKDTYKAHYYGYYHDEELTSTPSITVKKYVSIDGGITWLDAETASGPEILVGSTVRFKFIITNSGNVTLSSITLSDSDFDLSGASMPANLISGSSFEYVLTGISAKAGQHSNTATATGTFRQQVVRDTDNGHYFGAVTVTPAPSISVKKHVSVDGGKTWLDAETAPGPEVLVGSSVRFKFVIINSGNVPLDSITLGDSEYSLSGADIPSSLVPGSSFEYILTGISAVEGRHKNTATASGRYEQETYKDSDDAHYYGYAFDTPAKPAPPEPVKPTPTPEPEKPKPKPTPPTDGAYTSGLYYALVLFALAAIALKKGFPQGLALRLSKKR